MAIKSVVLGMPLTLLLRGANAFTSTPVTTSPAITAVTVLAPWVAEIAKSAATNPTADIGSAAVNIAGGFTTLADMNAQVVNVSEKRRMAIVSIPGRESDFIQDLGGHSTRYKISGKFFDRDPRTNNNLSIVQQTLQNLIQNGATGSTQLLRLIMRTAVPVPFMCEHEISMAVITDFDFSMVAGEPYWVNYNMNLVEYARIPYMAKMAMLGVSNLV
jgi:hypothetical protein